jgi:murein DD-endopeptidase MepM/ murein hydrolase activator NlpD
VVTTAFIGASAAGLITQFALPHGTVDPSALAAVRGGVPADFDRQQAAADRASRSDPEAQINNELNQADPAAQLWLLPMKGGYQVSEGYGPSGTVIRHGYELEAPEGTPFMASHGGVVTLARYNGALGYTITLDLGKGTTVVYGHAGKLLVHEGQRVTAGTVIGTVGDTGMSWGPCLYFAIEVNGKAVNPATYLRQFGLDLNTGRDDAALAG